MSRQTFTEWIFSWMANFKIDFRQPCGACKYNPRILACDGTKLGIYFKNVKLEPFEKPTSTENIVPNHKRTDRQFFSYSESSSNQVKETKNQAQEHLQYYIAKFTNCLDEFQKEREKDKKKKKNAYTGTDGERKQIILENTPALCQPVMQKFLDFTYNHDLIQSLCPVFKILASSYPLTSLINFRFLDSISSVLHGRLAAENLASEIPEVCCLLKTAERHGEFDDIKMFMTCLLEMIKTTHANDRDIPYCTEVLEEYNPELQGRAYYFTPHGGRLRDLPTYQISRNQEKDGNCRKCFEESSKSGTTFLFLWFDPVHGHCYGYHVINTSEGRKDPFASAFMYMEDAPDVVFYDFSCQLEEYCLNREPKFWRNCRFCHDIFHGFSHKCPFVYTSKRIPSLDAGVNTEICEQFNSYIQKIKYSARAMSQSHFMFYLQFFIHKWNQEKEKTFQAEQNMAQSLMN